jgi:DNA polymerase-3 subunit delta
VAKEAAGPDAPVHVIVGEDSYLAEEALERILASAIGGDRAEALTVVYGDEVANRWERVVNAARAGSLFASRRAVVVRRADLIKAARSDEADGGPAPTPSASEEGRRKRRPDGDPAVEPILAYLAEPAPDATLVLMAARPDRRRLPWSRLCKEGRVHAAEPLKGRFLRSYVEEDLRRRGLRLTGEAVAALIDEVGQDLRRLVGEVEKLEAWAGGEAKGALSADEVLDVLGRGMARPLYLLADCLTARDLAGAVERTQELLEADEDEFRFKIVATLHRTLRQVRAARALRERRMPARDIGARLLPPNMQFKLDALLAAAGRWSDEDLREALSAVDRADRRMKRGSNAATTIVAALAEACRERADATSRRGR